MFRLTADGRIELRQDSKTGMQPALADRVDSRGDADASAEQP